jgi:hypothetical protein
MQTKQKSKKSGSGTATARFLNFQNFCATGLFTVTTVTFLTKGLKIKKIKCNSSQKNRVTVTLRNTIVTAKKTYIL